jgi:hypothetical protein
MEGANMDEVLIINMVKAGEKMLLKCLRKNSKHKESQRMQRKKESEAGENVP